MKHLPLHWKIIIGMVLGVVFGLIAISMGWDQFTSDWIKPFGTIFIMFALGLNLNINDFIKVIKKPNNLIIGCTHCKSFYSLTIIKE